MTPIAHKNVKWVAIAIAAVIFIIGLRYYRDWVNTPTPETTQHSIPSSGYTKILVTRKEVISRRSHSIAARSKLHSPIALEFTTTGSPVDICVVPCPAGYRAENHQYINSRTEEFATGHVPKDVIAQASGMTGRIALNSTIGGKPQPSYLVLARGEAGVEMTLVVHYGPR